MLILNLNSVCDARARLRFANGPGLMGTGANNVGSGPADAPGPPADALWCHVQGMHISPSTPLACLPLLHHQYAGEFISAHPFPVSLPALTGQAPLAEPPAVTFTPARAGHGSGDRGSRRGGGSGPGPCGIPYLRSRVRVTAPAPANNPSLHLHLSETTWEMR